MRLPFWLLRIFFPPTDCPTVDPSRYSPPPRPALYPLVLRMLPTRFNGGLVRACTRLLRLLAATRCSWHSYLNVISMFLRTAQSYPCTRYVASPIPRYLILSDIRLPSIQWISSDFYLAAETTGNFRIVIWFLSSYHHFIYKRFMRVFI